MMIRKYCRIVFATSLVLFINLITPQWAWCQDPTEDDLPMSPVDPDGDPDAPIDGGIGLLVAAGVGYGIKKYRDHKRASQAIEL